MIICAAGNEYGYSWAADPYYRKLVQNLSPRETGIMLDAASSLPLLSSRLSYSAKCRAWYAEMVALILPESVPVQYKGVYEQWVRRKAGP